MLYLRKIIWVLAFQINHTWIADIFSDEVIKMKIVLLHLDSYLFSVISANGYLPRGSKGNILPITITDVTVSREVEPIVNMPFLDFVMIHWIQWNSFVKISIVPIRNMEQLASAPILSQFRKKNDLWSIHTCDFLNYCVDLYYLCNFGLYCSKWDHSHLQFFQLLHEP